MSELLTAARETADILTDVIGAMVHAGIAVALALLVVAAVVADTLETPVATTGGQPIPPAAPATPAVVGEPMPDVQPLIDHPLSPHGGPVHFAYGDDDA
jgi:hypothetical protein